MRRPYYRKQKPVKITSAMQSNKLPDLRERILNIVLMGACFIGTIALFMNLLTDVPRGDWGVISIYIAAYVGLVVLAFAKKLPYIVRATGFEIILFVLGVTATLTDGISGNGRVWFLGFVALGGIFLGGNSGIYALILAVMTYFGIGAFMAGGIIQTPSPASLPMSGILMDWVSTGVVFVLIAVTIIITLSVVIRDLNTSLDKEHRLLEEIGKDREELDKRTIELNRRLVQIHTAAEISRSISAVLDPTLLLQQVVDVVRQRFDLYYVGVFLLDDREEYAVLRAGTGDPGQKMMASGHKLSVGGSSMVGWTIAYQQARIALDTGDEAVRFNNPHLPMTRSEVALPLRSGDQIFGAISVQSSKPRAFDEDDVTVLQGITDSLATALNNARLFQQEEKNLEEIHSLNRQYMQDAWTKATVDSRLNSYIYPSDSESELTDASLATNLPIVLRDQVIGQISLELSSPDLTAEDRAFAEQITNQAALAMENVRLLEETQRRANHERLVSEIVKKARASADVDTIIRTTLEELGKSMKAVEGVIHLGTAKKMAVPQSQRSEQ